MEECPMWDGDGCPCKTFELDRDNLPTSGVFTVDSDASVRCAESGRVGPAWAQCRDCSPNPVCPTI
jgi:hypothetical protein